jgi:hypothetical protein
MTKHNMTAVSNVTYMDFPTWKIPFAGENGEAFDYYTVPDLRMSFLLSKGGGTQRVEFWHSGNGECLAIVCERDESTGDHVKVWERLYPKTAYGAEPWEGVQEAMTERLFKSVGL